MASVAVSSYFDHWPEDRKAELKQHFYTDLSVAEIDYAKCTVFDSLAPPTGRREETAMRLFNRVGARVSSVLDCEPLSAPLIAGIAIDEWSKVSLTNLPVDFKRESMNLPDIPHQ
jgi:hypothetical protein